jgi:UDP-glucose 4-epimerase
MNVLVTGGAGFIGSHIAEGLLAEGHTVVVLDPLDSYYDVGIKEHDLETCRETAPERFTHVDGSITNERLVEDVFVDRVDARGIA